MPFRLSPASSLLLSFALLIAIGALVLALPVSGTGGNPVSPLEALFTATSAVCVTGLTVVDTGTRFSSFGQTAILVLIQSGGLGILTFSIFFALLLGRKVSFSQREIVVGAVATVHRLDVMLVLKRVLATTFAIEGAGALLLWIQWRERFGGARAAWYATFHAVSAFCNAGFSTFPDSLTAWRGDLGVNAVVVSLVVAGGIGFVVFLDVENRVRYGVRIGLHTRTVVATSAVLILVGAAFFLLFERGNVLAQAGFRERIVAAVFAAVTPRTAGFNTVDYGQVTSATLIFTIVLMFIGGSPGSCAGGVKTTAAAILYAAARSAIRGRERPDLFRRSIPETAVRQSQTLVLLAIVLLVGSIFAVQLATERYVPYRSAPASSLEVAFEAVSAFGTVGLSTGITPSLPSAAKLVLVGLMFVGRVGPLTIALLLARRRHARFRYAEEGMLVG